MGPSRSIRPAPVGAARLRRIGPGLIVAAGMLAAPLASNAQGLRLRFPKFDELGPGNSTVRALLFTPDGKTLITAGLYDPVLRLWDVEKAEVRAALPGHNDHPLSLALSPDGKILAAAGRYEEAARLWDIATGKLRATIPGHHHFWGNALSFAPDGKTLAMAMKGGNVRFFDAESGRPGLILPEAIDPVAFAPDGKTLATGSTDGDTKLWDVATRRTTARLASGGMVHSFIFSADGSSLVTYTSGKGTVEARLWDPATGKRWPDFQPPQKRISAMALAPDGKRFATGDFDHVEVTIWDVATGAAKVVLRGLAEHVRALAFSPDGTTLAAGCGDTFKPLEIGLWDVSTGRLLTIERSPNERDPAIAVTSLAYSPDGRLLAAGHHHGVVRFYDLGGIRKAEATP